MTISPYVPPSGRPSSGSETTVIQRPLTSSKVVNSEAAKRISAYSLRETECCSSRISKSAFVAPPTCTCVTSRNCKHLFSSIEGHQLIGPRSGGATGAWPRRDPCELVNRSTTARANPRLALVASQAGIDGTEQGLFFGQFTVEGCLDKQSAPDLVDACLGRIGKRETELGQRVT